MSTLYKSGVESVSKYIVNIHIEKMSDKEY